MQVHSFIAESAPDAVAQIRAHLGPEAVVLNVRRLAGEGLARLWQRPRIEVLAYKPDAPAAHGAAAPSGLADLRQELAQIKEQFRMQSRQRWTQDRSLGTTAGDSVAGPARYARQEKAGGNGWRMIEMLEASGLLPLHAQRVADKLQAQHGHRPPSALAEEVRLTRGLLAQLWRKPPPLLENSLRPHVLIGPPGAGKTTCLCKWLKLPVEDLILTHLDEEMHWGKMWNLVLGTNYSIRFLSAGQNIPGDFCLATPEKLFSRQFPA